jgi:ABC-type nickel/cobalt efflux system permease component RcnA
MPLYVCASGATPLAAVLIHSGVSPGAGLAFLLTGPATNVTTFALLSKYHGRRFAIIFAAAMAALAVLMGFAVNALFDPTTLPSLFETKSAEWTLLQNLSLAILTGVFILSLLRRGPRNLINEIVAFEGNAHDHGHSHDFAPVHSHSHHPHQHTPFVKSDTTHKDDCCH